jgi:hypothetical protein
MINMPHPGTTPHDTEATSDLESATGQPGTIGDWAATLAKLLRVAFQAVDTDRECAKAAIARASSLLRVHVERSSFDSTHNRGHLEHRSVFEVVLSHSGDRRLLCLIAMDITRQKQAEEALGDAPADQDLSLALTRTGHGRTR